MLHSSISATDILFAFCAAAAQGDESFRNIFYNLIHFWDYLLAVAHVSYCSTSHLDLGMDSFRKHCPTHFYVTRSSLGYFPPV